VIWFRINKIPLETKWSMLLRDPLDFHSERKHQGIDSSPRRSCYSQFELYGMVPPGGPEQLRKEVCADTKLSVIFTNDINDSCRQHRLS
jgi:hypothetical protein